MKPTTGRRHRRRCGDSSAANTRYASRRCIRLVTAHDASDGFLGLVGSDIRHLCVLPSMLARAHKLSPQLYHSALDLLDQPICLKDNLHPCGREDAGRPNCEGHVVHSRCAPHHNEGVIALALCPGNLGNDSTKCMDRVSKGTLTVG